MDLITEAIKKGYRKGTAIRYVPHSIDYVQGNYFEIENGDVNAYIKPIEDRKGFDDFTYDTLYCGTTKKWVEIVK